MAASSAFTDLGLAQLYQLKSQYLAALQVVDQTETDLEARLEEAGRAREQLEDLMKQLDAELARATSPDKPAAPKKTRAAPRSRTASSSERAKSLP